jgi:hypothetical protein
MLADEQEALARLLVDRGLRRRWFADPSGECFADLALDPAQLASLRALDVRALERVAASLTSKRRRAILATVPHCARLWPELGDHYVELLAAAPARVEHLDPRLGPGPSELLRLLAPLRQAAARDDAAPLWLGDLLALELARACTRRDRQARSLRCEHPVHEALDALDRGWLSVELEPRAHEYVVDAARLRWRAIGGAAP